MFGPPFLAEGFPQRGYGARGCFLDEAVGPDRLQLAPADIAVFDQHAESVDTFPRNGIGVPLRVRRCSFTFGGTRIQKHQVGHLFAYPPEILQKTSTTSKGLIPPRCGESSYQVWLPS
jgi:hypothetical protein